MIAAEVAFIRGIAMTGTMMALLKNHAGIAHSNAVRFGIIYGGKRYQNVGPVNVDTNDGIILPKIMNMVKSLDVLSVGSTLKYLKAHAGINAWNRALID